MHYYQFHIGDYASHTKHLSNLEDLAYRRLLDLAYSTEQPLINDIHQLCRQINMRDHQQEVKDVLADFFELIEEGWINNRVVKEMAKIGGKSEKAKQSAAKRWECHRNANASPKPCERNANASNGNANASLFDATQDPRPKTQDPEPKKKKSAAKKQEVTMAQFLEACALENKKPLPADSPIYDYAASVGITDEMVNISWQEFKANYLGSNKVYADWRLAFGKCVRGNWMKIWWMKEGEPPAWTTIGEQARRAAA